MFGESDEVESAVPTPKASMRAALRSSVSMRSSSSSPEAKIFTSSHPALVNHADVWRIRRSGKRGADPEGVNARGAAQQRFDALLIQFAGGKNFYVIPPRAIEPLAHPLAVGQDIAAIEANAAGLAPPRDDFLDVRVHVVGVNEKSGLVGENVEKIAEGFGFIIVGHNQRVCLGSVDGNAKAAARRS